MSEAHYDYSPEDTLVVSNMHDICSLARNARKVLEYGWSDATAHHSIVPNPDNHAGRGQCGVSSVWLARLLRSHGYDAHVAEGIFEPRGANENLVWVHVNRPNRQEADLIVDITCDQFKTLNGTSVHVGEYGSGPGFIGDYHLEELFDPYANVHRKLMRRYEILEENIAALSLWRQWRLGIPSPQRR